MFSEYSEQARDEGSHVSEDAKMPKVESKSHTCMRLFAHPTTWTTHTPMPAIATAMKMWAMAGAGKGRRPRASYASVGAPHA